MAARCQGDRYTANVVGDSSEHPYGVFVQMEDGSVTQVGPNGDEHEDADMMLRVLVQRARLDTTVPDNGGEA